MSRSAQKAHRAQQVVRHLDPGHSAAEQAIPEAMHAPALQV